MNRMTIIGRICHTGELKYTQAGTPILELSVADSKKMGETWQVNYFRVSCFGEQATRWVPFCTKGAEIWAEGEYERREFKDRSGKPTRTETLHASYFRVTKSADVEMKEGPTL